MSDTSDTLSDGPNAPKAGSPPESAEQVVAEQLSAGAPPAAAARGVAATGYAATPEPADIDGPRSKDRLSSRTVSGGLWTLGTYMVLNTIRFAANLILTRILLPEMFGTMALVNAVMSGIRLFSDVGIGPALISNPRGEEEKFLRTAFTIQNIRGVLIWLVACMLAPLAADIFGSHDEAHRKLIVLLPVAGLAAVIDGLRSTAIFRIQRKLHYGPLSIIELVEMIVVSAGMVLWAKFVSPTVWALLIPYVISNFVGMCLTHTLMRDRVDRWGIDFDCLGELMRVGKWIFISTLVMFFASQFEKLLFGRLVDATTLGVYGIALGVAAIPLTTVLKLGGTVLFPTFSRIAGQPERFRSVYKRTRTMLLTAGATIVCGLIACGPHLIHAMYREQYANAGWMLQLLAIGVWFQIIDAANVAALLSQQQPKLIALGNATKVAFMLALVPLAYHLPLDNQSPNFRLGMAFVALGVADAMRAFVSGGGVRSIGMSSPGLNVPDVLFPVAIVAVAFVASSFANVLDPHVRSLFAVQDGKAYRFFSNGLLAAASASVVAVVWGPICLAQWRRSRRGEPKPAGVPAIA